MKLKGKIALITGASSGIGKETAIKFAEEGATVILLARHYDKLKDVEEEIKKKNGIAHTYSMDITKRDEVVDVFSEIIDKFKRIDILVNDAGIARWNPIDRVTYEDFDEQVKVNLTGCFNCIKEVVPQMLRQGSGSIINIITSTVKNTKSGRVAYAASKYGQAGLSNAVHEDLKDKGISVVAVYPSKTDTPIHDAYMSKDDPQREKMLKAKDVAEVVLKATLIIPEEDIKELVKD